MALGIFGQEINNRVQAQITLNGSKRITELWGCFEIVANRLSLLEGSAIRKIGFGWDNAEQDAWVTTIEWFLGKADE